MSPKMRFIYAHPRIVQALSSVAAGESGSPRAFRIHAGEPTSTATTSDVVQNSVQILLHLVRIIRRRLYPIERMMRPRSDVRRVGYLDCRSAGRIRVSL